LSQIVRVQGNAKNFIQGNSQLIVTLAQTPKNGNLLVAAIGNENPGAPFVVSSVIQLGVTWTPVVAQIDAANDADVEIWVGVINQAGASTTVTINITGTPSDLLIADICEYFLGAPATSFIFLDQNASNGADGSSAQTDTGTTLPTNQPNELLVGAIFAGNFQDASQINPTNGFTMLDGIVNNSGNSLAYLEKIVNQNGAANSGTTIGNAGNVWCGCIITIKAAPRSASTYGDGLTSYIC
jgi:hypothetical protein